jgi:hypothetical protein
MALDYRTSLLQLTQLWRDETPESRQAFHVLLTLLERERGSGPRSAGGHAMEGGTLEKCVWGGFSQKLSDADFQDDETIEEIAAYVTHRRPYHGRAYICSDFRPEMSEELLHLHAETTAFLEAVQDRGYMAQTERDALHTQRERLIATWQALPHPASWEQRTVCAEVVRQVFELLIVQMYFPGRCVEVWARAPFNMMMDMSKYPHPSLLPFILWGRRALNALQGTELVQLSWVYEEGHIAFSVI